MPTPDKTEIWVAVALFVASEVIGMSKAKDNSILQLLLRTARTFSPFEFPHRGAIFYLNTNNGLTVVNNQEVESIENRLLLFDPTVPHHSTTCTDDKCRVNVNFNFF